MLFLKETWLTTETGIGVINYFNISVDTGNHVSSPAF
jgi:hypothetical protein